MWGIFTPTLETEPQVEDPKQHIHHHNKAALLLVGRCPPPLNLTVNAVRGGDR